MTGWFHACHIDETCKSGTTEAAKEGKGRHATYVFCWVTWLQLGTEAEIETGLLRMVRIVSKIPVDGCSEEC